MFCTKCGASLPEDALVCMECGTSVSDMKTEPLEIPLDNLNLPMKWYKFLIYFSLIAGAILNVFTGIQFLTGSLYEIAPGVSAEMVYDAFPGLKGVDMAMAFASFFTAAFGLYTRHRLATYRKDGPALLNAMYILIAAVQFLYAGALFIAEPSLAADMDFSSLVTQIVVAVVMVLINKKYFKRRAHLFTK